MKKEKRGSSILGAIIILIIGVVLLWYNEGRTVKTENTIVEAKKEYIDISSEKVDSKNDNKLVATTGKLIVPQGAVDSIFNVKSNSAKLVRIVEMYQWEEKCETDNDNYESCSYNKVWNEKLIDSTFFEKEGYNNPTSMVYESRIFTDQNAKLGAFSLNENLLTQLSATQTVTELNKELDSSFGMEIVGNSYTNVKDGVPQIGDIRISFKESTTETVSILAVQTGETFKSFTSSSGYKIFALKEGEHNGAEILHLLTSENNMLKWILRIVGTLLVIVGVATFIAPLQIIANFIPVLGRIFGWISGVASLAVGLAISLLVIAIAWLRYRPIMSIFLIAGAIILFIGIKKLKSKNKSPNIDNSLTNKPVNNTEITPSQEQLNSQINNVPLEQQMNNIPPVINQEPLNNQINNVPLEQQMNNIPPVINQEPLNNQINNAPLEQQMNNIPPVINQEPLNNQINNVPLEQQMNNIPPVINQEPLNNQINNVPLEQQINNIPPIINQESKDPSTNNPPSQNN